MPNTPPLSKNYGSTAVPYLPSLPPAPPPLVAPAFIGPAAGAAGDIAPDETAPLVGTAGRVGARQRPDWAAAFGKVAKAAKAATHTVAKRLQVHNSAAAACVPDAHQSEQAQRWERIAADVHEPNPQAFFDMLVQLRAVPKFDQLRNMQLGALVMLLSNPNHRALRQQCFAHPSLQGAHDPSQPSSQLAPTLKGPRTLDAALYAYHQLQHLVDVHHATGQVKRDAAKLQELRSQGAACGAQAQQCHRSLKVLADLGVWECRMSGLYEEVGSLCGNPYEMDPPSFNRLGNRGPEMWVNDKYSDKCLPRVKQERNWNFMKSNLQWHGLVLLARDLGSASLHTKHVDPDVVAKLSRIRDSYAYYEDLNRYSQTPKIIQLKTGKLPVTNHGDTVLSRLDNEAVQNFLASRWPAAQDPEIVACVGMVEAYSPRPGYIPVNPGESTAAENAGRLMHVCEVQEHPSVALRRNISLAKLVETCFGRKNDPQRMAFWRQAEGSADTAYRCLYSALKEMRSSSNPLADSVLTRCETLPGGLQPTDIIPELQERSISGYGLKAEDRLHITEMALDAAQMRMGQHDDDPAAVANEVLRQFSDKVKILNGMPRHYGFYKGIDAQALIDFASGFKPFLDALERTDPEAFSPATAAETTHDKTGAEMARKLQNRSVVVSFLERHGVFERLALERDMLVPEGS
jgi:hypothetical protein